MPLAMSLCLPRLLLLPLLLLSAVGHSEAVDLAGAPLAWRRMQESSNDLASLIQLHLQVHPAAPLNGTAVDRALAATAAPAKMQQVEFSFRQKLHDVASTFLDTCHTRKFATAQECTDANRMLKVLIEASESDTDDQVLANCRIRLSMRWFLWRPGPPMSFVEADSDASNTLTWAEFLGVIDNVGGTEATIAPFRPILDVDHDGNITREELHGFMQAGILIRDQLPEVDEFRPHMSTGYCLKLARRIFYKPILPLEMAKPLKILILFAIAVACVLFIVCLTCGSQRK